VSERSERALRKTSILAMNQHPRNGYKSCERSVDVHTTLNLTVPEQPPSRIKMRLSEPASVSKFERLQALCVGL